jgi:chromate transporter
VERKERSDLGTFVRYFLWLGATGFGGPIATVGYMQRDLVERHGWVSRDDFLDGVALGQAMPGPLAAQVTMWVGYLARGALGALAVAVAFILPSFVVVLGLAVVYARSEGLGWVQAVFHGIAPGVMAIIVLAAVKLARLTNGRDARLWAITAVLAAVTAATGAEIAVLFLAGGLLILAWDALPASRRRPTDAAMLIPMAPFAPLAQLAQAAAATGASTEVLVALGLFFLKAGAFIFGSGLAIVPFLREGVVEDRGWLTESQFLDAVAMGLITPGPVVISATFIGYLVAGWWGAAVATVAIFIPIYLGVVVPGPWFVRHRGAPWLRAFVKGATAAAAGAIAGAWFVLTREALTNIPSGRIRLTVELTDAVALDVPAVLIFLASLIVLWFWGLREPLVVLACGLLGLALYGG